MTKDKKTNSKKTDYVIVGGGAAGLMAATILSDHNYNVVVLESMPFLGGNTILSAGIIQSAGTSVQEEKGILKDSPEQFINDLKDYDSPYSNEEKILSNIMHKNTSKIIDFLRRKGMEFVDFEEETPRYHIIAPEMFEGGETLIALLEEAALENGVEILLETRVNKLNTDGSGVITGVNASNNKEDYSISANKVILATGGFSSNKEIVSQYLPEYNHLKSRASTGALGDGLELAKSVGGYTTAMDSGQHMFHVSKLTGIDVPLMLLYTDSIIVNKNGRRYINESTDYNEAAKKLAKQPDATGYIIFDENVRKSYPPAENYIDNGSVLSGNSLEELEKKLGIDNLTDTIKNYNDMVNNGEDKDFKRKINFNKLNSPNYYAIEVEPQIYNSYGGLKIDQKARVVNKFNEPIPNLYAAGEVTGSVEVQEGLLYTTGIGQALVYGKLAAETAMRE